MQKAAIGAVVGVAHQQASRQFARVYCELFPLVYGYVRFRVRDPHVAEDLTAHIFERALSRLAHVRQPERIRAWLFTIARNVVADARRSSRPAVALQAAEHLEQLWVESLELEAVHRDDLRRVIAHLTVLEERERELIGLRFVGELRHREIAQILGLSEANVKQILHRALVKLRRRLDEESVK